MPVSAARDCARELHETTQRLSSWLDSLPDAQVELPGNFATPQQMAGLLSELLQAGEWLRTINANSGPAVSDPAMENEVAAYRKQVERLRGLLPSIHDALLRERARLERERERVRSVSEWARSSRQTL
jgi:hypothetical protein